MPDPSDSTYDFAPEPPPQPAPAAAPPSDTGTGAYDTVEPAAPARPASTLTPETVVERFCPHCGFRIVGRTTRSRCPDSAAPLDATTTDLLQFASTFWVRSLAAALSMALSVVLYILAVVFSWSGRVPLDHYAQIAAPVLTLIAAWLVTAREPGAAATPRTRAFARLLSLLAAALWLCLVFLPHAPLKSREALLWCALVATGAQAFAIGFHMRFLAVRVPSDSLASQALNLSWVIAAVCLFLLVLNIFGAAQAAALQLFFCAFPMIGGLVGILGWAIFFCLMIGLQLRAAANASEDIAYRKATRLLKKK